MLSMPAWVTLRSMNASPEAGVRGSAPVRVRDEIPRSYAEPPLCRCSSCAVTMDGPMELLGVLCISVGTTIDTAQVMDVKALSGARLDVHQEHRSKAYQAHGCYAGLTMSFSIFASSKGFPVLRIMYITLEALQATAMIDCIFSSLFCFRVV